MPPPGAELSCPGLLDLDEPCRTHFIFEPFQTRDFRPVMLLSRPPSAEDRAPDGRLGRDRAVLLTFARDQEVPLLKREQALFVVRGTDLNHGQCRPPCYSPRRAPPSESRANVTATKPHPTVFAISCGLSKFVE